MSTQIKRLYQNNTEFVPITLAEAVVVNTSNTALPQLGITTLDKALQGIVGQASSQLQQVVTNMNTELAKKQDKITWGEGFIVESDGSVSISYNGSISLYKVVTTLPNPSDECLDQIYLVPYQDSIIGNVWKEYICVNIESDYVWEQIGSVQTSVDLSGYVTQTQFNTEITRIDTAINTINTTLISTVTASNVTTSNGTTVYVSYEIPNTLYD